MLACLIGMFALQAMLKLKDVAEIALTKPAPAEHGAPHEAERAGKRAPSSR